LKNIQFSVKVKLEAVMLRIHCKYKCCLRNILQFFLWNSTFSFIFHSLYFQFYQWNIHKPGKSRELPLHSGAALPCLSTGLTSSKEIPKGRLFAFDPEGQYLISCDKTAGSLYKVGIISCELYWVLFGLWCLIPLSTIFQLYRGGQFY
jgi:hypothetical protein